MEFLIEDLYSSATGSSILLEAKVAIIGLKIVCKSSFESFDLQKS